MSLPYVDTDPQDVPDLTDEEMRAVANVAREVANTHFETEKYDWNPGLAPMRGVIALRDAGGDPCGIAGAASLYPALRDREGEHVEEARHKIREANPPI